MPDGYAHSCLLTPLQPVRRRVDQTQRDSLDLADASPHAAEGGVDQWPMPPSAVNVTSSGMSVVQDRRRSRVAMPPAVIHDHTDCMLHA